MSISDMIVVMKDGILQQIGKPQDVYDSPENLFVAKFLGTPPINVFDGEVRDGRIHIGDEDIIQIRGISDRKVWIGIRPEGFVLNPDGRLSLDLERVEVMGRDRSVVAKHPALQGETIRAIIPAENQVDTSKAKVRFDVKKAKLFLFDYQTEERLLFQVEE